MKEKSFDFEQVGKRMPYRMDEKVLQRVTHNVLEVCKQEEYSRKSDFQKPNSYKRKFFYILGSVAAIFLFFVYVGIGHNEKISGQYKTANISLGDSSKELYPVSDQYAENILNESLKKDSGYGIPSSWTETSSDNTIFLSSDENLPTDKLINELSDEDLLFLAEITGGTVADQWYN